MGRKKLKKTKVTLLFDSMGGACPYQAEGSLSINGETYPFYFRYRNDRAQFYLWEPAYVHEFVDEKHILFWRERRQVTGVPHLGYMEYKVAHDLISRWSEEFLEEHTWYCEECHEVACSFGVPDQSTCVCPRCDGVFCRNHIHRHTISSGACHD